MALIVTGELAARENKAYKRLKSAYKTLREADNENNLEVAKARGEVKSARDKWEAVSKEFVTALNKRRDQLQTVTVKQPQRLSPKRPKLSR